LAALFMTGMWFKFKVQSSKCKVGTRG